MTTSDRPPNRLVDETSPYLLQHAYNPVDWYPWGDEAIARSKEIDRPIFLSIGYSACHWCHVMEHESFENDAIAAIMNEHFVCVKVDREERPDLDQIYMNAVQLLTGQGGWPMSMFLTPDLKPFFGGTYWPPTARWGRPGFREVLLGVHDAWTNRRERIETQSEEITEAVVRVSGVRAEPTSLTEELLRGAGSDLVAAADRTDGGFGGAPKFPHPMTLRVLLRFWKRFGNDDALAIVTHTLDQMAAGGIYDHLGGGFARYSTDARWLVPHFEKMLYDNALLVPAYLEAFQATGNANYARVVRETLDYVLREMTQPEGGFYATQDADSEGEEGKFFVWSDAEIRELLGDDADVFCNCYDVAPSGNWEGKNILNRPRSHAQMTEQLQLAEEALDEVLARCRATLFEARSQRVAPGRDDKVLASWNGMMIAAMAQAARVLGESTYANAASDAARFILSTMRDDGGRLLHSFKDGRARFNAYLDDYVCLIDGLVELFQTTGSTEWLTSALELADRVFEQFADPDAGGFFYTSTDHEQLITRSKDGMDNATPSGNGMAAYALLRLGRITLRADIEARAVATLEVLSGQIEQMAMASSQSLLALDFLLGPAWESVLIEGSDAGENARVRELLNQRFDPNQLLAIRCASVELGEFSLFENRTAIDGRVTLYRCQQGACQQPLVGAEAIEAR
ncbi:MAG: thioredoxin domain-containing protein [Planctomycetota bacterium]|jgi:uncharacterized protein YyaL (SSP411 family)